MQKIIAVGAVVIFVVVFLVLVIRLQNRAAKRRTRAWLAEAKRVDLAPVEPGYDVIGRLNISAIFRTDDNPRFENVVTATIEGAAVFAMDHSATVWHASRTSSYTETICIVNAPWLDLPLFQLSEYGWLRDLTGWGSKVDVGADFDSAFSLRGHDVVALQRLFDAEAQSAIKGAIGGWPGRRKTMHLDAGGGVLVLHCRDIVQPAGLEALVERALDVARMLAEAGTRLLPA